MCKVNFWKLEEGGWQKMVVLRMENVDKVTRLHPREHGTGRREEGHTKDYP